MNYNLLKKIDLHEFEGKSHGFFYFYFLIFYQNWDLEHHRTVSAGFQSISQRKKKNKSTLMLWNILEQGLRDLNNKCNAVQSATRPSSSLPSLSAQLADHYQVCTQRLQFDKFSVIVARTHLLIMLCLLLFHQLLFTRPFIKLIWRLLSSASPGHNKYQSSGHHTYGYCEVLEIALQPGDSVASHRIDQMTRSLVTFSHITILHLTDAFLCYHISSSVQSSSLADGTCLTTTLSWIL